MSVHSLPGADDIVRHTLSNGIVVLVRENHVSPSVVFSGSLLAGALSEPLGKEGLTSFTTSMFSRGTQTHDFAAFHELLEGNGASLGFSGGRHISNVTGKCLSEDLPLLISLAAEALRQPAFPAEYVERVRGQIITQLKVREQYTRYVAARRFRELAYPAEHPYHRLIEGTVETMSAITREDMVAFHRQRYGPRGMIIAVVGAVQAAHAINLLETAFGDWDNPDQPAAPDLPTLAPLHETRSDWIAMPGKSQSDLVFGVPGPARQAPDWHAANLGNSILGVFGLYGRIGAQVREKLGMAYYSYGRLTGGMGPGAWQILAGVNPVNLDRVLDAIRAEVRRFVSEPVTADELADNKANYVGALPLRLETNDGVTNALLRMERYGLGLDYLRHYADLINAITAEDILAAAQHYLDPDCYVLAVAGPGNA